jgi:23S rRNA pseudoU1915 N3-methylase RlmH
VKPLLFQVRTGTSGDMIAAMVLFPYSELGHKDTISVAVACVAPGVWKTVEKTLIEFAKEHKKHLKLPPDYDIVELETKLTAKKQTPKAGKQASAQSLLTALEQIRKEVIKIGKRARSQALSVVDSKTLQTELDKYEKQLKTIKPKIRKVTGGEKQDELDEFYAEVQEELHDARNTVTKEAGQKVSKKSKKK